MYKNHVQSKLNSAVAAGDNTIQVVKAVAPYQDPPMSGYTTLADSLATPSVLEIISYSGITDNGSYWTLTGVIRGLGGTIARSFVTASPVYQAVFADDVGESLVLSSQPQAETGTDNTTAMTPLRVRQSILTSPLPTTSARGVVEKSTQAENDGGTVVGKYPDVEGVKRMIDTHAGGGGSGAWDLIETMVASSGDKHQISGMTTDYSMFVVRFYMAVTRASGSSTGSVRLRLGDAGGIVDSAGSYTYHAENKTTGSTAYSAVASGSNSAFTLGTIASQSGVRHCTGLVYITRSLSNLDGAKLIGDIMTRNDAGDVYTGGNIFGAMKAPMTFDRVELSFSYSDIVNFEMSVYGVAS